MEDVLEVYTRPYDRRFPAILLRSLHAEARKGYVGRSELGKLPVT
jgi:hypothetical protein